MKEIFDYFNDIKNINYGWHDKEGKIHEKLADYRENFVQQDSDTIVRDNYAVCWEMCELQREFFNKNNIENKTILAYLNKSRNNACHTFSVFYKNGKVYWFEASWKNKKGIHEFNSLDEILDYYRDNFEDFARSEYNKDDMLFYDYDGIIPGMNAEQFLTHCLQCKTL